MPSRWIERWCELGQLDHDRRAPALAPLCVYLAAGEHGAHPRADRTPYAIGAGHPPLAADDEPDLREASRVRPDLSRRVEVHGIDVRFAGAVGQGLRARAATRVLGDRRGALEAEVYDVHAVQACEPNAWPGCKGIL